MIKILTTLVAATITVTTLQAQTVTSVRETPKLVIGITIDQLRGDYLELFQSGFSSRGFKRLLNEGLVYQNVKFDLPNLDDASAIATIYTGTTPFYHHIIGDRKYTVKDKQITAIFADDNYLGNYTQDKVSPLALKASTITDELKIASRGASDVYSFAPQPSQALASAGRLANCAFWIDDHGGQWASTTYYKDFYWIVDQENRSNAGQFVKAWGYNWNPLLDPTAYKALPYSQGAGFFQHNFGSDKETYKLYKRAPLVNEGIRDIASKVLSKADMGKRLSPDFLAITFYAGNYPKTEEYSVEIQDTYLRLDREIEKLLDEVDKSVGLKNTFIFVTSTGYYNPNKIEQETVDLKDGTFYVNRCEALLNMYLMAIYGQEQWVEKYYNEQIYLNKKLIEDKNLSLKEIQDKAAEFVSEFTGVQNVYTSYQIKLGEWNPVMEYYKNSYTVETAGDLFVEIQPGYKIVNEQDPSFVEKQIRNNAIVCPLIFFGNGIKAEKIKRTVSATEIAPTVSHVMRIRPPNAAKDQPLPELF